MERKAVGVEVIEQYQGARSYVGHNNDLILTPSKMGNHEFTVEENHDLTQDHNGCCVENRFK